MNQTHRRAYATHLVNAKMLETGLLTGCAHVLCLELNVQDVTKTS